MDPLPTPLKCRSVPRVPRGEAIRLGGIFHADGKKFIFWPGTANTRQYFRVPVPDREDARTLRTGMSWWLGTLPRDVAASAHAWVR
jgi:hypothetical protein